ncbi:MAG: response regulator [Bacteroidetes bacterium]|nr:response regulator [Bacteroidota bacterium]
MKKNILIIDDHDGIRMLLGSFLSKKYSVTGKRNAFEGMAWMSKGNIPDLILLDICMPELDGCEFLYGIRYSGCFRNIPVIVLSGSESSDEREQCFRLGVEEFISKPFNPLKLNHTIGKVLN